MFIYLHVYINICKVYILSVLLWKQKVSLSIVLGDTVLWDYFFCKNFNDGIGIFLCAWKVFREFIHDN